ncbi:MAG: pyridoxal-phosphate dependent enzyme [Ignavibacteriaceae bacterium]
MILFDKLQNKITPLQKIEDELLYKKGINLFIKREDLIHPEINGNKWHKLKYNFMEAKKKKLKKLLTFGGAYSNHIYSTAAAGNLFELETIGIIRGEENLPLNPTLKFALEKGMTLQYIDRNSYRNKYYENFILKLKEKFGDFYFLPEGGTNSLAVKGCAEIINRIEIPFNYICVPCGTGGTLAGLISGLNGKNFALGFSALKNKYINNEVEKFLLDFSGKKFTNWRINFDYHFGAYAKFDLKLKNFLIDFYKNHKIKLEPIYTGKMMFGIYDLVEKDFFKKEETIIAVHTGGLQGLEGFKSLKDIFQ